MTAPSTLELTDLDVDLTIVPACEEDDCDQAATHVTRRKPCPCMTLACSAHVEEFARSWQEFVERGLAQGAVGCVVSCASCGQHNTWPFPDQPWTVVPL